MSSTEENHISAKDNSEYILKYLNEELESILAILSPFDEKPMAMHVSPLLVRNKQKSNSKRTNLDLSWQRGGFIIKLSQMYNIDISRAFHHIKVGLADTDFFGLEFLSKYFLDRLVLFEFHCGLLIFERCTNTIHYIVAQHGFTSLLTI